MNTLDTSRKNVTFGRFALLALGCAMVTGNLVVGVQFGRPSSFAAALGFGVLTVLWYQWTPANIFARPLYDIRAHPLTPLQRLLIISGSVLILSSVLLRWVIGI